MEREREREREREMEEKRRDERKTWEFFSTHFFPQKHFFPFLPLPPQKKQFDLLKELVSALQDVERGHPKNLSSLLEEVATRAAAKPSAQEAERLRLEVASLRSEATRLRDRLRVAEEEVDRARRAAGQDVR